MRYSVEFTRAAAKGFRRLPTEIRNRVSKVVDGLADNPKPEGAKALKGSGNLLRIRVGSYRIVYRVEEGVPLVLVITVGHRKNVYRRL